MNRKYLIIMIATCLVCLGIGAFIGAGLRQNNLAATAASIESQVESIIDEIDDAQKKIEELEDKIGPKSSALNELYYKGRIVSNTRREVVEIIAAENYINMPYGIYDNCDEVGVNAPQPDTVMSSADWDALYKKLKSLTIELQNEINTAESELSILNEEYQNAIKQMKELLQELHIVY